MQTYLKTKPAWMQLLLFLGMAFGLFLIGFYAGTMLLSKMTGISVFALQDLKNWDMNDTHMLTFVRGLITLQFFFLFLIPTLLFAYFSDPQPMHYLGLKPPGNSLYWILGLVLIVVAYPFVEWIGYLNQKIMIGGATDKWMKSMEEEAARQIQFMLQKHTPFELVKNLIFVSLFAGIGEELFFHGILQRIFIRITKNPWMGIVLTAAIFSGIHFQFYGFFPRLFLGILLGAIYWYSGSLWTAILAHFLYDGSVIVFLYLNPALMKDTDATIMQGSSMQLMAAGIISLLLTIFVLLVMKRKSNASFYAVYHDDFPKPDEFSF